MLYIYKISVTFTPEIKTNNDMKRVFLVSAAVAFIFSACNHQKANWVATTDENRWQQQTDIVLSTRTDKASYMEILTENPQQEITVKVGKQYFTVALPAKSFNTVIL
jgi:hypothetical protein